MTLTTCEIAVTIRCAEEKSETSLLIPNDVVGRNKVVAILMSTTSPRRTYSSTQSRSSYSTTISATFGICNKRGMVIWCNSFDTMGIICFIPQMKEPCQEASKTSLVRCFVHLQTSPVDQVWKFGLEFAIHFRSMLCKLCMDSIH